MKKQNTMLLSEYLASGGDISKINWDAAKCLHVNKRILTARPTTHNPDLFVVKFEFQLTAEQIHCTQIKIPPPFEFDPMSINSVLRKVRKERMSQQRKWGEQNHTPTTWIAILTEEVGEAAKEAIDHYLYEANPVQEDAIHADLQTKRLERYREELIQVAAVAVQMIECLDRNTKK